MIRIVIEGVGEILLEQSKSSIEALLGRPAQQSDNNRSFYNDYELRIDFDEKGASFIEFIYGPFPEKTELSLYGINPFQIGADNLIDLLSKKNDGEVEDDGYSYSFLNISVGVYREATENDVQESIDEAKYEGIAQDRLNQLYEELEISKNFMTVELV